MLQCLRQSSMTFMKKGKLMYKIKAMGVIFSLGLAVLLAGCAQLRPNFEQPQVTLESLEMLEQNGFSQRFRIGLRLTNPNSQPLAINGMSYTLGLNGFKLVSGVSNRIPELAPYTDTKIFLEAGTDLFEALRLIGSLTERANQPLQYELNAKLDLKGLSPTVHVKREGKVELDRMLNP